MSNRINKKGISEIFSTVLIVGMSIVALTLLTTFIFGILEVTKTQLAPATECISAQTKIEGACVDKTKSDLRIKIKISEEGINNLAFSIISKGSAKSYYCGEKCGVSCTIPPGVGQTKTLHLPINSSESIPEEVTLIMDGCSRGTTKIENCRL